MITRNDSNIQDFIDGCTHVIVQFGAPWCVPCRLLKSSIEKVSLESPDIFFAYCDIESTPDFSKKMKVQAVPTVIGFHNGAVIENLVGPAEDAVKNLIEDLRSRVNR